MEWIIIAHRTGAEVYRYSEPNGYFHLLFQYSNPNARLKDLELRYAPPGQSRAKFMGSAPHSLNRERFPHEDAANQFANYLAHDLMIKMQKDHLLHLRIAAETRFLGKIKKQFNSQLIHKRIKWIDKGLEKVPQEKWPGLLGLKIKAAYDRFLK